MIKEAGVQHLLEHLVERIKKNKNVICCFLGPTGSGKSWASLWLAEELSKMQGLEFPPENICFKGLDLLKRIETGLPKGSCLLLDEAGIELYSRSWQSSTNKLMNFLLQVYRYQNLVTIFTLPHSQMLDKHARALMHLTFEFAKADIPNERIMWKPLLYQVNQRTGKIYPKYLIVKTQTTNFVKEAKFTRQRTYRPSPELEKKYERLKIAFGDTLVTNIRADMEADERKKQKRRQPRELSETQHKAYLLFKEGLSTKDVAYGLNKSISYINRLKQHIITKGWAI